MTDQRPPSKYPSKHAANRERRLPTPLNPARMDEMALAYVARFATSAGKLADFLRRKLRERGWDGDAPADIPALIKRFVDVGYVDDAGYARAKGQGLLRRGYGVRRIDQALTQAGIAEEHRQDARGVTAERRHAALTMARKRRFGPFGNSGAPTERTMCEKQVAALLRAGHPLEYARRLVNAATIEAAEEWVDEEQD